MALDRQQLALYQRAAKIERYRRDFPRCFAEQFAIRPKLGPVARYPLWPHQMMIEEIIQRQMKEYGWIRLAEFKCRQEGGSTHGVGRMCHQAFFNENISSLIVAHDDAATENLFNMAQLYYDSIDADIRPVRRYLSKQQIVLENPDVKTRPDFPGLRSRVEMQSARNVHAGVSTTRNFVELSEFCRFGKVKDLMGSLLPAIPLMAGTGIIVESAPFGYGEGRDHFREWCNKARSGKDQYAFVAIYWWMCPGYERPLDSRCLVNGRFITNLEERRLIKRVQEVSRKELGRELTLTEQQLYFRRLQIEQLGRGDDTTGVQIFQQQYPHDYESGWIVFNLLVFEPYLVAELKKKYEAGPRRRCEYNPTGDEFFDVQHNAPLYIWEDPLPGEVYDIGVDTAQGGGGNHSIAEVFKRSNNEQVAEYASNKIGPLDFGRMLFSLGTYYNNAHLAVEVEGIGYATNEALNQLGYPNIYRWRKRDHAGGAALSPLTGWKTQFDTKTLLVAVMQDVLAHNDIILHSSRVFSEMTRFIHLFSDSGNDQFVASEGDDDAIMATMIAQVARRDEMGLDAPMMKGAVLEREATLAERNARMQKGIEEGIAYRDKSDREDENVTRQDDPWAKFENAMRGKDVFDA